MDEQQASRSAATNDRNKVEILHSDNDDETNLTIVLHEEDHTIGNVLKHIISQYSEVEFCGYNVPHPLEDKILIRVQTRKGYSAASIIQRALHDVECIFGAIREKFQTSIQQYRESIKSSTSN